MKDDYPFWVEHKKDAEKFFGRHWQAIRAKANAEGCFSDHMWTKADISELKNNYTYWMEHRSDAEEFFGRTFTAIQEKAIKEGCISDYFWTDNETSELIDNYKHWSKHKKEAEKFFGRCWKTIIAKANKEGCISDYFWTDDQLKELRDNYPFWSKHKKDAEKFFGRRWGSVTTKAWEEGIKINFKSNHKILSNCTDMINGLLLSDAHIGSKNNGVTGHYDQSCIKKEWLIHLKKEFDKYGIVCDVKIHLKRKRITYKNRTFTRSTIYKLVTSYYVEFGKLRDKWYSEGEKIVPDDIELTPEWVANWYLGDGSITRNKKNMFTIRLHTNGFLSDYVIFLSDLLNDTLDICSRTYIHSIKKNGLEGLVIHILRQNDIKTFLNYIRDFWIECYSYKFPIDALRYSFSRKRKVL